MFNRSAISAIYQVMDRSGTPDSQLALGANKALPENGAIN
jgi:hypothetical protein